MAKIDKLPNNDKTKFFLEHILMNCDTNFSNILLSKGINLDNSDNKSCLIFSGLTTPYWNGIYNIDNENHYAELIKEIYHLKDLGFNLNE